MNLKQTDRGSSEGRCFWTSRLRSPAPGRPPLYCRACRWISGFGLSLLWFWSDTGGCESNGGHAIKLGWGREEGKEERRCVWLRTEAVLKPGPLLRRGRIRTKSLQEQHWNMLYLSRCDHFKKRNRPYLSRSERLKRLTVTSGFDFQNKTVLL